MNFVFLYLFCLVNVLQKLEYFQTSSIVTVRLEQIVVVLRKIKYRVIHKSLRDFRTLRYSSRDGHAEGEHVNRGRDTPSFCPTLQVLNMFTLGDAPDVNPVIKFLPQACNERVWQELCYRIDICRVTKGGHIEHL